MPLGSSPTGPLDPQRSAEGEVEAANRVLLSVEHDVLEDTLSDILRASARRHGIDL
jgi:hypothetical protein